MVILRKYIKNLKFSVFGIDFSRQGTGDMNKLSQNIENTVRKRRNLDIFEQRFLILKIMSKLFLRVYVNF